MAKAKKPAASLGFLFFDDLLLLFLLWGLGGPVSGQLGQVTSSQPPKRNEKPSPGGPSQESLQPPAPPGLCLSCFASTRKQSKAVAKHLFRKMHYGIVEKPCQILSQTAPRQNYSNPFTTIQNQIDNDRGQSQTSSNKKRSQTKTSQLQKPLKS